MEAFGGAAHDLGDERRSTLAGRVKRGSCDENDNVGSAKALQRNVALDPVLAKNGGARPRRATAKSG